LVILFISLFAALCVELDLGTHKEIRSVLAFKLGVTLAKSNNGGLKGHETREASTKFSVHIRTVQHIWKLTMQNAAYRSRHSN
jgi:hypothetical protein